MRASNMSIDVPRIAVAILFSTALASVAPAQTPQADVESALIPGTTVWVTELEGQEEKAGIVAIAGKTSSMTTGGGMRGLSADGVVRVRARHFDSVLDGALIGASATVASWLFMCMQMEPWENCRDDYASITTIGLLGAGIGITVDALIQRRWTIYETAPGSTTLRAAPIGWPSRRGIASLVQLLTRQRTKHHGCG